jgi:hypothetical protein
MKTKTIFLLVLLLELWGCSNHDDTPPPNPIDLLPPATQTGENTFGCLLDGKAFTPRAATVPYNCFYQYVDGGYYFYVTGKNSENGILKSITVGTENLEIMEGDAYALKERISGNAFGRYYIGNSNTGINQNIYTSDNYTGELTITKLDFENHIVSGTFWFDIIDEDGIVHEIREGRFDMRFTE